MVGKRVRERDGNWRRAMPRFLVLFLGSGLLVLAVGLLLYASERGRRVDRLAASERERLESQANAMEGTLLQIATDLLSLSRNGAIQRAAEHGIGEGGGQLDRQSASALARDIERFAGGKRDYLELALYDRKGHERMHLERAEGEPVAVFPDGPARERGRSPVELDELPVGQVRYWLSDQEGQGLRFATGVRADGQLLGSLVLACRGEALLAGGAEPPEGVAAELRIMDRHARSVLAFAGDRPAKRAYDPSTAAPELWQQILAAAEGQASNRSGITSYRDLKPGRPLSELTAGGAPGGWKIVAHVSGGQLGALMTPYRNQLLGYALGIFVLLGLGSGLLVFGRLRTRPADTHLDASRERFERLIDDARELVITAELQADAAGTAKLIALNRAATDLFGYDAAEVAQMSLGELVVPDSLEAVRRHLAAARSGRAGAVVLPFADRSGKTHWLEITFQRTVAADGGSTVLRGLGCDVSERKGLECALRELEQLLDLEAAASAALHHGDNLEGALAAILNRPELESSGWVALYAASDAKSGLERLAFRVLDSKDKEAGVLVELLPVTLPEAFRPLAGGERPFRLDLQAAGEPPFGQALPPRHAACWIFPLGRSTGVTGTLLVFTHQTGDWPARRLEAIGRIAGACGQFVARRLLSAGLAAEHAALETSRSETARAGDSLPCFLTHVSDRLRLPARRLVDDCQRALAAPGHDREGLESAARGARGLARSIEDILTYAELEAGRLEVAQTEFVWRDVVREALDTLAEAAMRRGLTLRAEIEKQIPSRVIGDGPRVRQVLDQLLGNALRFTEHGEVVLKVQLARESARSASLQFTVHDTGCGIPDSQQNGLFAPFGQGGGPASRRHRNGGLGLSLASRLVRAMGGTMWMQSVPGQGSNFHFTCPFGLAQDESRPQAAREATPQRAPAELAGAGIGGSLPAGEAPVHIAPPPSLRLLVAEESEASRQRLGQLLEAQGHRVQLADSAIQAIELLAQQDYDGVLISVQMRDMDGLTATRAIRDYERAGGAHLPVVALSAEAMAGDRARCEAAGMDYYLSKPIDERELLKVIVRLAQGLSQDAATGAQREGERKEAIVNVDTELSVFDRAAALDRVGGDLELLVELAGMFMEDCPQLLVEIENAVRNGDSDALSQSAHTLKGAVGNFSAQSAYDAAYVLEKIGRSGDLSEAASSYRVLKQEIERLQPLLGALA
ncbi:response regulator [bacterium]|nr:response regulator [bacterium]